MVRLVSSVVVGRLSERVEADTKGISAICEKHVPGHNGETGVVVDTTNDLCHL